MALMCTLINVVVVMIMNDGLGLQPKQVCHVRSTTTDGIRKVISMSFSTDRRVARQIEVSSNGCSLMPSLLIMSDAAPREAGLGEPITVATSGIGWQASCRVEIATGSHSSLANICGTGIARLGSLDKTFISMPTLPIVSA